MWTPGRAPPRARPGAAVPTSAAGGRADTPPDPPKPSCTQTRGHVSARPPPQGRRSENRGATTLPLSEGSLQRNVPARRRLPRVPLSLPPSQFSPARRAGGGHGAQDAVGGRTSCGPPPPSRARAASGPPNGAPRLRGGGCRGPLDPQRGLNLIRPSRGRGSILRRRGTARPHPPVPAQAWRGGACGGGRAAPS
ncbi:unnamed protein product [Rangifer tarandus platyrhynchus]|uniref:Uncharacterized protein n=1 Tax=Rangifer tarandus platyrhynchus TaxID=3082113 RepID=A0ABN9A002_RANTA|nr:unnamed protein product [Rangifer tarandus platyrhynchus]